MSLALVSSLTLATFMIVRACWAYRRVLRLSSTLLPAGLSVAIMAVLELPPRLSFNSLWVSIRGEPSLRLLTNKQIQIKKLCTSTLFPHHVRTESLYGMKTFFLVSACSDKAEMTFPSVSSDLLMLAPSYKDTILHKKNK